MKNYVFSFLLSIPCFTNALPSPRLLESLLGFSSMRITYLRVMHFFQNFRLDNISLFVKNWSDKLPYFIKLIDFFSLFSDYQHTRYYKDDITGRNERCVSFYSANRKMKQTRSGNSPRRQLKVNCIARSWPREQWVEITRNVQNCLQRQLLWIKRKIQM